MQETTTFEGANGVTLRATVAGPEQGDPVLLLHGGGQTRHSWSTTQNTLAGHGFLTVAVDLRGHGESDWAEDGRYELGAFADDLRHVIETFDTPPALVGASLGGLASLLASSEHPAAKVKSIVLVDVVPWMEAKGGAQVVGFMRGTSYGFDTLDEAADAIADYLPHRPRPEKLDGLSRNMRQRDDGRWYWHWDPAFVAPQDGWDMDKMNERLTDAVLSLDIPLLLLRGSESEIVSDAGVRRFRELLPHGQVVEVEGARHMVAGDENDAFLDGLIPFLKREKV